MIDKEKVIIGLEVCLKNTDQQDCPTDCPYLSDCSKYEDRVIFQPLMRDALALLKEQAPRVMTLEEALVDNNNSIEISPYVFVEIKGRNDIFIGSVHDDIYGDYHSDDIKVRVYRIWMSDSKTYSKADYMKTVRFWNRKPTDEQRLEVKWE